MRTRVPSTLSWMSYALCVMFISANTMADNAPPGIELHTAHYDLYTECPNPQETATILEQFYDQLQKFFGKTPDERLKVKYFSDKDRFAAALKADGIDINPLPRGIYSHSSHACFAIAQPSAVTSREVLLHECVHQFHWLAMTQNLRPSSGYYVEGLAEYFAHHYWNGKELKAGWYSSISCMNVAQDALAKFRSTHKGSLRNILIDGAGEQKSGDGQIDYYEAYTFVTFLITQHPKEFHELAGWLDNRYEAGSSWDYVFWKLASGLDDEYRHWLELRFSWEPLSPETGLWEQDNMWLEGISNSPKYANIDLGHQCDYFVIDVKPTLPEAEVALWSHTEAKNEMVFFNSRGLIGVRRSAMDTNSDVEIVAKREMPAEWRMTARRSAGKWIAVVDGKEVSLTATDDSILYLLLSGRAEFRIDSKRRVIPISP